MASEHAVHSETAFSPFTNPIGKYSVLCSITRTQRTPANFGSTGIALKFQLNKDFYIIRLQR